VNKPRVDVIAAAVHATASMTANQAPSETGLMDARVPGIPDATASVPCAPALRLLMRIAADHAECALVGKERSERRLCKQAMNRFATVHLTKYGTS
jgi:hypothetical protein